MRQHVEVRRGEYHDSVTLLAVSRTVAAVDGVAAAQVAMATPLNVDVLQQMGFELPSCAPEDLVVAIRVAEDADEQATLDAALAALTEALSPKQSGPAGSAGEPARTSGLALRRAPAPLVLVSVPGEHAATEAWDALTAGASVMLFSDNVSVADEVALKTEAARRGLLVMGPDCGTAVVGGVGLGFANVVRPGPVSLVAASGTGAQHLMALLDAAGVGVRHCLGLGGRDLGSDVGGLGAAQALRVLAADEGTELVVVVSKPADDAVVQRLRELAADLGVQVEWATLGPDEPDLTAAAERVCARLDVAVPAWPSWQPDGATPTPAAVDPTSGGFGGSQPAGRPPKPSRDRGLLRGLFAGGTLCDEAMAVAGRRLGPVASNIPLAGWPALTVDGPSALGDALAAAGHAMVDLGDDALTLGRAHPMIDPSLRLEAVRAAADDDRVRVVLLDVVLGHGAHADPASEHAPVVRDALAAGRAAGRDLDVVVSLTGTVADPQGRDAQARALAAAGAHVLLSNAAATQLAVDLATGARA
ncbi:MAG: FdrA family protein [Actinomycetes bacterium]